MVKEELSPVENRKTAPESNEHIGGNSRRTRGEASTSGVQEATGEAGEGVGGDAGARFSWVEEVGGFLSLPEVEVFDGDEFAAAFVNRSRPAVIKVTPVFVRGDLVRCCTSSIHLQSVTPIWASIQSFKLF